MNIISTAANSFSNTLQAAGQSIVPFVNATPFNEANKNTALLEFADIPNIAGFTFDIVEEDGITLQSEITDHYSEDNSPLQDHIAIKPETIMLKGNVSELTYYQTPIANIAQTFIKPFNAVTSLIPTLTTGVNQAFNAIQSVNTTLNTAMKTTDNLVGMFNSFVNDITTGDITIKKTTKQQKAYNFFYNLWQSKQVFNVTTPWIKFENMAIEQLSIMQGDTKTISEFNIKFKKLRFSQGLKQTKATGRRVGQLSDLIPNANVKAKSYESLAYKLEGFAKGK